MTPLLAQVSEVFQRHIGEQRAIAEAAAKRAADDLPSNLAKLDAAWLRTEAKYDANSDRNSTGAWSDSLRALHEERRRKYTQEREELLLRITSHAAESPALALDMAFVESVVAVIERELLSYGRVLGVKRRQTEQKGEYGRVDSSRWHAEIRRFVAENPNLASAVHQLQGLDVLHGVGVDWIQYVARFVDLSIPAAAEISAPLGDGLAFEKVCADILESIGWAVTTTKLTGDQGVDLVAEKAGFIVAIQCKNTSRPAGVDDRPELTHGDHSILTHP